MVSMEGRSRIEVGDGGLPRRKGKRMRALGSRTRMLDILPMRVGNATVRFKWAMVAFQVPV